MNYKNYSFSILFVDDEEAIIKALSKLYSSIFNVKTAISAEEARMILEKHNVGILVVDHNMPKETGIEFLESISNDDKHYEKIMLTASNDLEIAKAAINTGQISHFINKPINNKELKQILKEAADQYIKYMDEEEKKKIDRYDAELYRMDLKEKNKLLVDTLKDYQNQNISQVLPKLLSIIDANFKILKKLLLPKNRKFPKYGEIALGVSLLKETDLIAKEFNLLEVRILIQLIFSNLYIINNESHQFRSHFETAEGLLSNIDNFNASSYFNKIIHHLSEIPEMEFNLKERIKASFNLIDELLNYNLNEISQTGIIRPVSQEPINNIAYVIIIKEQLPIYTKIVNPRVKVNPDLISNFVVALSLFAYDIFTSQGSINTILHDMGVVLVQKEVDDIYYIAVANQETLQLRSSLQQFANSTLEYIKSLKSSFMIRKDDKIIKENLLKCFNII